MERYPIRTSNRPRPRRQLGLPAFICLVVWSVTAPASAQPLARPAQQPAAARQTPARQMPVINPRAVPRNPAGQPGAAMPAAQGAAAGQPLQHPGVMQPAPPGARGISGEIVAQDPFNLTPGQQAELNQMLQEWEARSAHITLFRCNIKRWEYDKVFNQKDNGLKRVSVGEMKYKAPDRGLYRIQDEKTGERLEDWRCDGVAIYEFAFDKKQLIKRTLPPELQGKAIANGPLPFIFSAKAETLKKRYFMRLKPAPKGHEDKFCLEALPRTQADAANFSRAELWLTKATMMPFALHLVLPNGKSTTDHQFSNIKENDLKGELLGDFDEPRTPFGWTKLIDPEEGAGDVADASGPTVPVPGEQRQAIRATSPARK